MTTLTYTDAYLKTRVTDSVETRALADVDNIGTFPTEWRSKLAVVRAYIITCLELGGQSDDTYSVKLGQYNREWDFTLGQAKQAANATADEPVGLFSIPIERA